MTDKTRDRDPDAVRIDENLIARAEAMIAGMRSQYLDWAKEDLRSLEQCHAEALALPEAGRQDCRKRLFAVAHDIKGQGGSFGFPLMTRIGNQLCRYIESRAGLGEAEMRLIARHIAALRQVIDEEMDGEGHPRGEALCEELAEAVRQAG